MRMDKRVAEQMKNRKLKIVLIIMVFIRVIFLKLNRDGVEILILFINQGIINLMLNIFIIISTVILLNHSLKKTIAKRLVNFLAVTLIREE